MHSATCQPTTRCSRRWRPHSSACAGWVTTCTWKDGRTGVYYGTPKADRTKPLITVTGEKGTVNTAGPDDYDGLLLAIAEFFHTGRQPFDQAETIEVFEFMTAADLSKQRGGAEVKLADLRK